MSSDELSAQGPRPAVHMAVKNWHWGKLILCWVASGLLAWVAFTLSQERTPDDPTFRFIGAGLMLIGFIGSPVTVFALTWRWLSGKEKREP